MSNGCRAILLAVLALPLTNGNSQIGGFDEATAAPATYVAVQVVLTSLPSGSNGITYYGGPVITSPAGTNVYYIWYGDWSNNNATEILTYAAALGVIRVA